MTATGRTINGMVGDGVIITGDLVDNSVLPTGGPVDRFSR